MFVAMDRHHYNKASLPWISDVQHQQENVPDYHALCSVLNKKKVKIFHSTLRSRIRNTDKGDKIMEPSRLIARSNLEEDGFEKTNVPQYLRGYSDQDLLVLSGMYLDLREFWEFTLISSRITKEGWQRYMYVNISIVCCCQCRIHCTACTA